MKPPCNIVTWVEEIQKISKNMPLRYTHILREGNKLADALENQALDKGVVRCQEFRELEIEQRRILDSDKTKILYLRSTKK